MSAVPISGEKLPKSARLLKSRQFRFPSFRKHVTDLFVFVYSTRGEGRLGVSISKKVLRRANQRNRVRRLLREAFRKNRERFKGMDLHCVGRPELAECWRELGLKDISDRLERVIRAARNGKS